MGLKQPKKDVYHGCELSGDLELTYSPGRARTSLKRAVHSAMSSLLMGPCWAVCWGAAIVVVGFCVGD
jgi:hypothetical protein